MMVFGYLRISVICGSNFYILNIFMRIARETIFFALQRMLGSNAGAAYRFVLQQASWSTERFQEWQQQQFNSLARHAIEHCAFYRDRFDASKSVALTNFPIISKNDMTSQFMNLMTDELRKEYQQGPARGYSWLKVTSGGTTGLPTTVIHDADFRDKDRAARCYALHLGGFPFGTPHFRLWGSMNDIQRTKSSFQQRVISSLANETLLNAFQMDDRRLDAYIHMINESKIDHILAYVDAAHHIAQYAKRTGINMRPLKSVMTTGGTLTDDVRAKLRTCFGARIHNKYGSRDAGEIGCDCEHGNMHVLPHIKLETVDENGKTLPAGETGRVLITFLGNLSFPLIRYDITDMAARSDEPCACGRPFPVLKRLEGRSTDFLFSTQGGYVSPVYIRHLIGVVYGPQIIRRFQLVQESAVAYTLTLQPESGVSPRELENLRTPILHDLHRVLGSDASIEVLISDLIPETSGGKFRYIINRYVRPS
jgi:phenylacetate-CoA ligase